MVHAAREAARPPRPEGGRDGGPAVRDPGWAECMHAAREAARPPGPKAGGTAAPPSGIPDISGLALEIRGRYIGVA